MKWLGVSTRRWHEAHGWFAWYPVTVGTHNQQKKWVWLEKVIRERTYGWGGSNWEYKERYGNDEQRYVKDVSLVRKDGREMKYALFGGLVYYPNGGWKDFHGFFDSLEAAEAKAQELFNDYAWYHILNMETLVIVKDVWEPAYATK